MTQKEDKHCNLDMAKRFEQNFTKNDIKITT